MIMVHRIYHKWILLVIHYELRVKP
jgi:hypothetical protein